MKVTGPDTRMIKIGPDEWVHVRGDGVECSISHGQLSLGETAEFELIAQSKLIQKMQSLKGKRVLILELAE